MKLHNIFEAQLTRDQFTRYLIIFVDGAFGAVYIITDIPPISEEKFQKLYKLSFEANTLADWISIERTVEEDWDDEYFEEAITYVMDWKGFVAHIKEYYPPDGDDDFDE